MPLFNGEIQITDSSDKTITGRLVWDRTDGGTLVAPSGVSFPTSPVAGEWFWRSDTNVLYRRDDTNTAWVSVSTQAAVGFLEGFFQWSDTPGPVTIGIVPAGSLVEKTVLEVQTAFDNGVDVTVGETSAQARLMAAADSRLTKTRSYMVENDYLCPTAMTVKVYFSGTTPTVGVGRVILYYS
jgi:hypothetical protein